MADVPIRQLHCRLRDEQQKCLVLSDPCELKALHLNGQNINQQGNKAHLEVPSWPPGCLLDLCVLRWNTTANIDRQTDRMTTYQSSHTGI